MSKESPYLSNHQGFVERSAVAADWVKSERSDALATFHTLGFPTRKDEDWKYTDVSELTKNPFAYAGDAKLGSWDTFNLPNVDGHKVLMVNGNVHLEAEATEGLPDGVVLCSLQQAFTDHEEKIRPHLGRYAKSNARGLTALNTAYLEDGLFLWVPRNKEVQRPIHVAVISKADGGDRVSHPRILMVLEQNSSATLVEQHLGSADARYFSNVVTEAHVAKDARLEHHTWTQHSDRGVHIQTVDVEQFENSSYSSRNFCLGGKTVRFDFNVRMSGQHGNCFLDGLYLGSGKEHVDNHTRVDHSVPHCYSKEVYKGILSDRAHSVFNGKVVVHQDAQKTDAHQKNSNLLLSDNAAADSKPELEIYADDVRCSHGSTIGQMDENALFYLQSRGIDKATARQILTQGFASELVQQVPNEDLRAVIEAMVNEKLNLLHG